PPLSCHYADLRDIIARLDISPYRPQSIAPLFPSTPLFRSVLGSRSKVARTSAALGREEPGTEPAAGDEAAAAAPAVTVRSGGTTDRKSTRLNSSHVKKSYAVFCLKKKKQTTDQ